MNLAIPRLGDVESHQFVDADSSQNFLMKNYLQLAATFALAATSFLAIEVLTPKAALAQCNDLGAINVMNNLRSAGADWGMAWRAVREKGMWDGSELCAMEIRGAYKNLFFGGVLPPMP